jgi:hypothetical protein
MFEEVGKTTQVLKGLLVQAATICVILEGVIVLRKLLLILL